MVCALLYFVSSVLFCIVYCQRPNFEESITRRCSAPDPVGVLDCTVAKITLPYVASWTECANSLFGENLKTTADIINYRCKGVWEGKGIPDELYDIRECVREKFGDRARNAPIQIVASYEECEKSLSSQSVGTAPIQQLLRSSSVEYNSQAPVLQAPQQIRGPVLQQPQPPFQQLQAPLSKPQQSFQMQMPFQDTQPMLIQSFYLMPSRYAQALLQNQQQNVNRALIPN